MYTMTVLIALPEPNVQVGYNISSQASCIKTGLHNNNSGFNPWLLRIGSER